MKKISLRTILLTTFIPAIVMPIALSTSCSKNNIWTKTFENGDDLLEWAADFPIIKDSPTFKDGYESATWFSNHMNNEFVAKLIVNNILQRFSHSIASLPITKGTEITIERYDNYHGFGTGWFVELFVKSIMNSNIESDFSFATAGYMKMYYLHNSPYVSGNIDSGKWFNIMPIDFEGDYDVFQDYTIGMGNFIVDNQTIEMLEINSSELPFQIPSFWIPNIVFDYSNDPY